MFRITRRVALVGALSTAIGLGTGAATASAASTISGLPSKAPLISKLYVPVTVTVSCQSPEPFPFPFSMASVTIRQVVAGRIAHGTASVNSPTCDGATHDLVVNVFPDTGGFPGTDSPPFKLGNAVITAQLSTGLESATAGPQTIRLTR